MTSSLPHDEHTPDFSSDDASLDGNSIARRLAGVVAPSGHPHARAMLRASILGGIGPSIGRYSVRRVLGSGGLGVVFEAHDPVLDRLVAIKLMHAQRKTAAAHARLAAEARAIAALSHPHVVAVYEVGEHDGELFVVMEHVAGTTLADWLALEQRSVDEVLDTMLQAGEALVAVHAIGLVHCDFKPQNVLVGADGRTRVADFGIAPAGQAWAGTAAYMPPEQRGGDAQPDAKGDQYAFCLVLHEALTTRRPAGTVPRRLARIVAKGRHDDPRARHPSMAALVA
ncbi:MAG TPA: serine/threonine-protein kinase, partial [Nannocystaceae bacterium]|nr:serine/threonine-protein kinase [Nannocystaceae bacterium]